MMLDYRASERASLLSLLLFMLRSETQANFNDEFSDKSSLGSAERRLDGRRDFLEENLIGRPKGRTE